MNCPELRRNHRKHYEIALWHPYIGLYPWWRISGSNRWPSRCEIGTPWPQTVAKTLFQYVMNVSISEEIKKMVENIGVEPMTSCVQGRRSSQLS